MSQYNCNGRTSAYCYAHLDTSPFTCITLARPKQVGFNTDTDLCGLLSPFETQQFVRRFGCTAASCNHAAGVIKQCLQLHWPKLVLFNIRSEGMIPNECCVLISKKSNFVISMYELVLSEARDCRCGWDDLCNMQKRLEI